MKRSQLLQQVIDGRLTLAAAAPLLGVSYRHAKRLKAKFIGGDPAALVHGNRSRAPANQCDAGVRRQVLELSQEQYRDFNDQHFVELLGEREGIDLSRETVRRWRRAAGQTAKRPRRAPRHRRRRERKEAAGMMILWDGSPHRWFGPDDAPCCLMAAMDDATGEVVGALFVPHESSWAYLRLLEQVIARVGVPHSVYQDCHSALRRNDDHWTHDEQLAGRQDPTQVGAALAALAITPIFAGSPQAKGRIERLFETLQDRLVALLALAGISDIAAANAYVQNGFRDKFNRDYAVAPQSPQNLWRTSPPAKDRERILALSYAATVGNDNTVRIDRMTIDIKPGPHGMSYAKARVQVLQLLDGSWRVYYQGRQIGAAPATQIAELTRTLRRRRGIPAAHDAVYRASAPDQLQRETAPRGTQPAAAQKLAQKTPSNLRVGPVRHAGPGQIIQAKRIA